MNISSETNQASNSLFRSPSFFNEFADRRSWEPGWLADFRKEKWEEAMCLLIENVLKTYKTNFKSINFLSCNNFIKIKNNLLMIEFIKTFSDFTNRKINYYIIGDGQEKNEMEFKLKKYKKFFNFKIIKQIKSLPDFLINNKIHFFMNFSSQEGMSFSIMEALSCGIPVISSDISANKNLVNKSRGYIINLKNFKSSCGKVTHQITNDIMQKKRYLSKSNNAINFINKNLINKICYNQFYKKIKRL